MTEAERNDVNHKDVLTAVAVLQFQVVELGKKIDCIDEKLSFNYVQKEIFEIRMGRIEKIVYGMAAVVLIGVITALMRLVVH